MLRRNGPVVKSVGSFLRLEGSLWWERFVKEVSLESRQTTSFHIQALSLPSFSLAPGSRATPSLATSWDCACGLENERDFPDSWTQLTSTHSKGMWGTHLLYLFRTKLCIGKMSSEPYEPCRNMTFWETVDMGIKVTVAWHRFRPFKRLCTCTGVRICFQITFWTTQYTYWLSLFSVLLTKSLIFFMNPNSPYRFNFC